MDLKVNDIIKHKQYLDTAILINTIEILKDDIVITGAYINLGFTESFMMGYNTHDIPGEKITIKKNEWLKLINPEAYKCFRDAQWEELK